MPENERKRVTLDGTEAVTDNVWWTKTDEFIGRAMVSVAQKYEKAMQARRDTSRRYVQLHKGQILANSMYDAAAPREYYEDIYPCWNVVQAGVNTAQSVVIRNRVRVALQTSGLDYKMQDVAKLAELAIAGIFAGNKVYEQLDPVWFLDGAVPGLGILLCEPDDDGNIIIERVIPDELIYSEADGLKCKPRQIFRVQWMSKWEATERYGDTKEKKEAINACTVYEFPLHGVPDSHVPLIPVYTGWFLPSKRGAEDGRRVVAIPGSDRGCTLRRSTWKHTRIPMAFFRVEHATAGLWGVAMAERLAGFQYRLNELNYLIEEAARLGSVGKWMVDSGSSVNPADLNNDQAGIVTYTTKEPKFVTIDGVPRDLLKERDTTYAQALKEIGLSEWTVGGVQPANIESGEGLQQLREQEQGRALPAGQQWEASHVDLAEISMMAMLDAVEKNPKAFVTVDDPDGDGLRKIELAKLVDLINDPDAWQARTFPTSILPNSPTARFEKLTQWRKDGWIDQTTFAALSEMPDIQQESSLLLSGIKAVRHAIGKIVSEGAKGYEPPDPAMPLDKAMQIAHSTYLKGLRTGMPEEKLSLLLAWIDDVKALKEGPPAPTPAAAPAAPQGGGGAPPAPAPAPVDPNAPPVDPGVAPLPTEQAAAAPMPSDVPPAATGPVEGAPV